MKTLVLILLSIVLPATYGQWKTNLRQNPAYFPKENVYVGVVVVLLEEDDFPSSNDVANKYYPLFTDKITKRLQCLFLKNFNEKIIALKSQKNPMVSLVDQLYKKLTEKASGLGCDNAKDNIPAPKSDDGNSQDFGNFIAEAEKELQKELISNLGDPWWLNFFLPGISIFINVDDFIGANILIWKWTDLEKNPLQSLPPIEWNKSTGSEDGSFNLLVEIQAFPVY